MGNIVLVSIAVLLRIISNPLGNVFQKQLTLKGNNPLLVNFLTYFSLTVVCLIFVFFITWQSLPIQFWTYSLLVGITGALGNGFLVKALQQGDLSVLGPINSYKSVIGIFMGILLLGEIPEIWGITGIVLIIYGSYIVLDTTRERFSLALFKKSEIQFRIWAMLFTAIEAVFLKKVILASSSSIAFISWCSFGAVFSFILMLFYRVDIKKGVLEIDLIDFGRYALLIGCIGTMQLTTNYAFEKMAVGYALALFQLSIIISVLFGSKFFKEQNISKKIFGSIIMVIGSLLIILLRN